MAHELPPPDPYESLGAAPEGVELLAPAVVYLGGKPSRQAERIADAILAARPGALIVVERWP
jgi:hypothetical protein